MKLLQVSSYFSPSDGGPYVSVRRLSQELFQKGVRVEVAGVANSFSKDEDLLWHPVTVRSVRVSFPQSFAYGSGLPEQIAAAQPDIIHTHGIWRYPSFAAYRYCARNRTPLVVSPRGMLEPWAFHHNAWKKKPLWWAYEQRALQAAHLLHATADQEAESLRILGLTNPIAVVANGVDIPADYTHIPTSDGTNTALFLSRIHPKKGLLNLINAWSIVRPKGWRMIIAGTDEAGHKNELCEAVRRAGLEDVFVFVGPVFDESKEQLFRQADLFILPSYSENFGISIAEALAYGLPVITTTGTPWRELQEHTCGWWVDIGVNPLEEALRDAVSLSGDELQAMGVRGRRLVEDRYAWTSIALSMKAVYEWVLGGGPPPDCVRMN
jgi:glycosyltransferase involved in cell wall biosynthesis